ncbi:MAG: GAP family protein [Solirubrobacterales bacterium]|nr:GAP family protein [Solirubrobacterales bacterium]
MGEALGQVLPLGVGVALSPVPIIGVVLMLGTSRARVNGPVFLIGWLVGIVLVGTIVLAASGGAGASENHSPARWASVLEIVLGVLLLLVAVKQWRGRPRDGDEPEMPKWMRTIDSFTVGRAAVLAVLLSAVNPKNLLLVVAAATSIAQTGASSGDQAAAFAVFAVIASLGVGAPVVIYFALGERSARLLDGLKAWMSSNNAAIMATICLIIAAKLVGDGITGLSG